MGVILQSLDYSRKNLTLSLTHSNQNQHQAYQNDHSSINNISPPIILLEDIKKSLPLEADNPN